MMEPKRGKKRAGDNSSEDSAGKKSKEEVRQDAVATTVSSGDMDIVQASASSGTAHSVSSSSSSTTVVSIADIHGSAPATSSSASGAMIGFFGFSPSLSSSASSGLSLASTTATTATSGTDPKAEVKSDPLPEKWRWVCDLIDEAHLPTLGLPARWDSTSKGHMLQAFDPKENRTIHIETGKVSKKVKSPVGFITSTKDQNPMPGAQAPAAVRYERYMEPRMNEHLVQDARENQLAPCIAHGDYVLVEGLQSDHAHPKDDIITRQISLVEELNKDPILAKAVMELDGIEKFFVKTQFPGDSEEKYFGTLYFYELYFNDIDNIWLICQACNHQKSNEDVYKWFKDQWLYGEEFLNYLASKQKKDAGILEKTKDKRGLATVAIEWFWERHAHYMSNTQYLFQDIITPIQILNIKVDRVIGERSMKRAERLQASLGLKMDLMAAIANVKGLGMPKTDSESEHESSDDDDRLPLTGLLRRPTTGEFTEAGNRVEEELSTILQERVSKQLREVIKERDSKNQSGQSLLSRLGH